MKEADNNLFAFISGNKASQRPGWLERGNLLILFAFNTPEGDTYQIIVADAADAVSVNFSGRCKFFSDLTRKIGNLLCILP